MRAATIGNPYASPALRAAVALKAARVQRAWKEACAFDGIDPASDFVVFSAGNPYAESYDEKMREYLTFRRVNNV